MAVGIILANISPYSETEARLTVDTQVSGKTIACAASEDYSVESGISTLSG